MSNHQNKVINLDQGKEKMNQFIELNSTNLQEFERSLKDLENQINIKREANHLQELSSQKLDLMHQFNFFLNQQQNYHTSFISNYDQQRILNKLKDLETKISKSQQTQNKPEDKRENLIKTQPKKFSFKKTGGTASQMGNSKTMNTEEHQLSVDSSSTGGGSQPGNNPLNINSNSENLLIRPTAPISPLHILALSDLSNIVLDLRALAPHLSTLQLSRIDHAAVLAPPLSGSVSLAEVTHSILLLISQQVRTYKSEDLILLLNTSTGPVIEKSKRITIAPYPSKLFLSPEEADAHTEGEGSSSQHHLPNDFDYPDSSFGISPNFKILHSSPLSHLQLSILFQLSDLHQNLSLSSSSSCYVLPQSARTMLMEL
ncbi:hypothetical protein H4Q26_006852 [Puccinia striiformis f. sp. tritici PST-130]|uniref:C-CAP/cofactor C-like domain-containing protein n=1 Tax=Puccinia striiformis f. sp. tritici PST-78 TaxID=1165861 RepID=A0A0L0UXY3_9BASI|nr:hypothetical protein H4Q26_006852 [Puccinia striiformis f. sp. tritici PST-130]KNE91903.1 hypothetical protein PSTG_14700 [Puccinia striiformis f. sp. tritici PST-78]KNE91904.1 hypothetical protein, variant [Puccinia striiformis f. sp. tritici PST-78]